MANGKLSVKKLESCESWTGVSVSISISPFQLFAYITASVVYFVFRLWSRAHQKQINHSCNWVVKCFVRLNSRPFIEQLHLIDECLSSWHTNYVSYMCWQNYRCTTNNQTINNQQHALNTTHQTKLVLCLLGQLGTM